MFLQQLINGLTVGSTYALVAIGFSMVFGVLELTNLAHSSVFMFGAYIAAVGLIQQLPFGIAIIVSIFVCGLLGVAIDRIALMPMRKRGAKRSSYLTVTIGLSTFIQNLIILVFGSESLPFKEVFNRGIIRFPSFTISYLQIGIYILTVILMIGTTLMVNRTKIGASMRAVAQNPVAAKLMGINLDRVITFTFFFGSSLAAVAGIMVGTYYRSVETYFGAIVGMKTIAAAVIGGIGVLPGAVLGGFLVGVGESLFAGYVSASFKDAVAFIMLIAILLIKPVGLLGRKKVNKI